MQAVGLTEMFFETQEPENAEVPIPEWLANLPAGDYEFEGLSVDGVEMDGVATIETTSESPAAEPAMSRVRRKRCPCLRAAGPGIGPGTS